MSIRSLTSALVGWHLPGVPIGKAPHRALQSMELACNTSLPFQSISDTRCTGSSTGDVFLDDKHALFLVVGNPIWFDASIRQAAEKKGQARALAFAWEAYGTSFPEHLKGEFAIAIIDYSQDLCLLVNDRIGRYPVYYLIQDNALVFASSASAIFAHPKVKKKIDPQGLYNYIYFHMLPSPGSIYQGIKKLPAGHVLEYSNGSLTTRRYWIPAFDSKNFGNEHIQEKRLKELLRQAVASRFDQSIPTGAFLSGGLDSSTVVGMMAEIAKNDVDAFSIGFSAKGYDEIPFARTTAKHFGVRLHEYYVTPEDVVAALPLVATSYDEPFGNSSALPAYFCAKFAKESGMERLLAGDGGDELFAGNERYAKQLVFERYYRVPEPVRSHLVEPIANLLPRSFPLLGKARSYIEQAKIPLPDRLQSYNFLHQHDPGEIFSTGFLDQIDPILPLIYQREIYTAPRNASTVDRMLFLDWQYTLADNDLRKVSHMCAISGIDVSYPMIDDSLVEFSCQVPDEAKLRPGELRRFYKNALRNWLPNETISKKKQGFGLPFGVWMKTHRELQALAYDSLHRLKNESWINGSFIDRCIKLHKEGHAAYYGELVWILTVLDLWLNSHTEN